MTFGAPWMLLGMLAVGIPLWIHLRKSRKPVIRFPAAEILLKVTRHRHPRLKLHHLVLLALRMLLVAILVLAAARPSVNVRRPGGIRAGQSLALVAILDDSLSMQLTDANRQSIYQKAKEQLLMELDRLRPGDVAAVIFSSRPARLLTNELDFDIDRVKAQLQTHDGKYSDGDLKTALQLADRLLRDTSQPQQEVLLLTDLSDADTQEIAQKSPFGDTVNFRVVDAGLGVMRQNCALDDVRIAPHAEGASQEFEIVVQVSQYGGTKSENVDVFLEVNGVEVARGGLAVPPTGTATKRFHHRFDVEGVHRGVARIRRDALPMDDTRHFAVWVRQSITALIIDGDYRPGSYRDEAFYLCRALETAMPGEVAIKTVVVDAKTAAAAPLSGSDVTFLVGMNQIERELAGRIIEYVRNGGGIFVSPAPQGNGLSQLASILPAKVRSIKQASRKDRPSQVTTINRAHPIFAPFGNERSGLEGTQVWAHLLVEPETTWKRATLIELANGLPLLLERSVDKGSVMLLTTTVDRDWTDLPIRPGYLPLVHRIARHLAGRLDDRGVRRVNVGQAIHIEISQGMQRLIVRSPDEDSDHSYSARELAGKTALTFADTSLPGHYRVWADIPEFGGAKELPGLAFVVQLDPRESDVRRVVSSISVGDSPIAERPVKGRLPIWPYLLMAAFLLLIAETGLVGIWLRRSHRRPISTRKVLRQVLHR